KRSSVGTLSMLMAQYHKHIRQYGSFVMPSNVNCPQQPYCEMREQTDTRFISQLTRNTFAIILAGGRGSRLMQLTDYRSKPAVPFAGKFRILDFTLSDRKS